MKTIIATLFVAAVLCPRTASAMEISMFDDMASQDQTAYVTYLVKNAEQVLLDLNQRNQAAKLHELFSLVPPDDHRSVGEIRFQENLEGMRSYLAAPGKVHFTAMAGEVENALIQTMFMNGLTIPRAFDKNLRQLARTKPFWPKLPLRTR